MPTVYSTAALTFSSSIFPTYIPSVNPSVCPTNFPGVQSTVLPSVPASFFPLEFPTAHPSRAPTLKSSDHPSVYPNLEPSTIHTISPTFHPSISTSINPSHVILRDPTVEPTKLPILPSTPLPSSQSPSSSYPSAVVQVAPTKLVKKAGEMSFHIVLKVIQVANASSPEVALQGVGLFAETNSRYIATISSLSCTILSNNRSAVEMLNVYSNLYFGYWNRTTSTVFGVSTVADWPNLTYSFEATLREILYTNLTYSLYDSTKNDTSSFIGNGSISLSSLLTNIGNESTLRLNIYYPTTPINSVPSQSPSQTLLPSSSPSQDITSRPSLGSDVSATHTIESGFICFYVGILMIGISCIVFCAYQMQDEEMHSPVKDVATLQLTPFDSPIKSPFSITLHSHSTYRNGQASSFSPYKSSPARTVAIEVVSPTFSEEGTLFYSSDDNFEQTYSSSDEDSLMQMPTLSKQKILRRADVKNASLKRYKSGFYMTPIGGYVYNVPDEEDAAHNDEENDQGYDTINSSDDDGIEDVYVESYKQLLLSLNLDT
jgi:hypothetical protein